MGQQCPHLGSILNKSTKPRPMSNPYVAQILSQGKEPSKAPAPKATYPRTIGARVFQTEADYQEALADWLNSN